MVRDLLKLGRSFIDACMAAPLGALLCGIQMLSARNDMFSNVFEIAIACIISFVAAGLASTGRFCYTALVSGGVVLILPVSGGSETRFFRDETRADCDRVTLYCAVRSSWPRGTLLLVLYGLATVSDASSMCRLSDVRV